MIGFGIKRNYRKITPLNSKTYLDVIYDELESQLDDVKSLYEYTVKNWVSKPEFIKRIYKKSDSIETNVYTKNQGIFTGSGRDIYFFLDYGTKERWALLSSNWESKSMPNTLETGDGAGYVIARGKKIGKPQNGVEARGYTYLITKMQKPEYMRGMRNAHRRGIRRMVREANED